MFHALGTAFETGLHQVLPGIGAERAFFFGSAFGPPLSCWTSGEGAVSEWRWAQ
jgi:hypothetical protein